MIFTSIDSRAFGERLFRRSDFFRILIQNRIFVGQGLCTPKSTAIPIENMVGLHRKCRMNNRTTVLILSAVLIAAVVLTGCMQKISWVETPDATPPGGAL